MSKINILTESKPVLLESSIKEILTKIINNTFAKYKLSIVISKYIYTEFPEILSIVNSGTDNSVGRKSIIEDIDIIISNNVEDKEYLYIYFKDLQNPYSIAKEFNILCVTKPATLVDIHILDDIIVMEKPEYLLMSISTLGMLQKQSLINDCKKGKGENIDAYYHSYKNIPIAITEFLDAGIIETVRRVKAPN